MVDDCPLCPACGSDSLSLLGVLGRLTWLRCIQCGMGSSVEVEATCDVRLGAFGVCSSPAVTGLRFCEQHSGVARKAGSATLARMLPKIYGPAGS